MRGTRQMPEHNDIIDISLGISKKRFRIDGDDNKILELNTSDFNIMSRFEKAYPILQECDNEVRQLMSAEKSNNANAEETQEPDKSENKSSEFVKLTEIDAKMKAQIDYIFDSNVSEICAGNGSMYDLINGYMRYEIIIDSLTVLYGDNLTKEMNKVKARIKTHTAKYSSKKKR